MDKQRHSLAHILAMAAKDLDPEVKMAIGPVIENGFYYDFEFSKEVGANDLPLIEKKMRTIINKGFTPVCNTISKAEAKELFKNQPYKLELIDGIEGDITTYTFNDFTDLCEGPHVDNSKDIDPTAFKITHTAGAYWRGDEKNKMLTRIYGLAFNTKEKLKDYIKIQEEAKKRDHRKLGKELDLFTFSPLVGAGLPLWTPKGTIIRSEIDNYIWELRKAKGYQKVTIPHITKKDLYEKSGHWDKFGDELFRIKTREGKEYAMKPMNCPHHTQIFAREPHSYKDMPQRYAETTMVYRDEQSGELGGLIRVLSITQDDAHVFCRFNQLKEEFFSVWDIVDTFYSTFGFTFSKVRLSFHDPETMEKYIGTEGSWQKAEDMLREIAKERKTGTFEVTGEAALYGPKIDFMASDSLGREHQVATIQLDLNLPERFDLTCINEKGEKERIVMIHAAIAGSLERFGAVLIEHFGGAFPLWFSPVQVKVVPIGEDQMEYAKNIYTSLKEADIRVEIDRSNETLGKKIRNAKKSKVPYVLVIGAKEVDEKTVTVEHRDGNLGAMHAEELLTKLQAEISSRS